MCVCAIQASLNGKSCTLYKCIQEVHMYTHTAQLHTHIVQMKPHTHTHTHTADLGDFESKERDTEFLSDERLLMNEVCRFIIFESKHSIFVCVSLFYCSPTKYKKKLYIFINVTSK